MPEPGAPAIETSRARGTLLLGAAAIVLAAEPSLWLARTWFDPAYDSLGGPVLLVVGGLLAASVASGPAAPDPAGRSLALRLLALTALLRLLGRLLAINVVGAFALVVDVYALVRLLRCHLRPRPVSALGVAAAFSFALPVERLVQRFVGFPLQLAAASGAAGLLRVAADVERAGTRIVLGGKDVHVDLPCSGARGLVLLLFLFAGLVSLGRLRPRSLLLGLVAALGGALCGNTLRVALLSAGIAYPRLALGADVMAWPWHDAVGLATLGLGALPVVLWARRSRSRPSALPRTASLGLTPPRLEARALLLLGAGLLIFLVPGRPLDVSAERRPPELPRGLGGEIAVPLPLSAKERAYFTRFGGGAAKAVYGPHTLLVVRTTSPLRHLHAPDECLAGSGHRVERAGVDFDGLPSAVYRSQDPAGRLLRVAVTFVSDEGEIATSVAEVAWRWMRSPGRGWTELQRVSDWNLTPSAQRGFDAAVARAFDIPMRTIASASRKDEP